MKELDKALEVGKPLVLVVASVYQKAREIFERVEEFQILSAPVEEEALAKMVKEENAFAVVVGGAKYTGALYESFNKGGLIARFGVGYDGINFEKVRQHHLLVSNTPEVLESTVAEFTLFLAGEVLRKAGAMDAEIKQGNWSTHIGHDLHGKVWAILGLGRIGKKLSQMLAFGFGLRVFALKRGRVDEERMRMEFGVEKVFTDYAELAPLADIVSLHFPAKKETHHFLNQARLGQLKPGAILVNTGRGSLVDENALYDVLKNEHLAGAGLDVFAHEPYRPVNPEKDLRKMSNVVLSPHIASSTLECTARMTKRVIQNIRFALEKEYKQMDLISE